MRVARLSQLFASSRLSPGGGIPDTRMSLAGVANFVRIYREQQTAIERQYQDAFAATAKSRKWAPAEIRQWYTKPVRTDTPTVMALTSTLMDGIDSLLGVLDAQAGTYAVTRNTIRFQGPGPAAREYMRAARADTGDHGFGPQAVGGRTGRSDELPAAGDRRYERD